MKEVFQAEVKGQLRNWVSSDVLDVLFSMLCRYLIGVDTWVPEEDCETAIVVQPSTLQCLKKLLGDDATPKSMQQVQLLQLVLDCNIHVIGILPTAGGKSTLHQAPAF